MLGKKRKPRSQKIIPRLWVHIGCIENFSWGQGEKEGKITISSEREAEQWGKCLRTAITRPMPSVLSLHLFAFFKVSSTWLLYLSKSVITRRSQIKLKVQNTNS